MDLLQNLIGPVNQVETKQAPKSIYWEGDTELIFRTPKVSVVGTRKPSELGVRRARRLAREICKGAGVVVSGLAEGIDTVAHTTAIEVGGSTIAVLGTGLDVFFPAQNRPLQEVICKDHLAVSQFPPGTPAKRPNFPQRNRTMALLSDATVIVEAGETSGTRHQGWEALRLGRPLFILQSMVEEGPAWVAEMLEYGAKPLTSSDTLFRILPAISRSKDAAMPF